MSKNFIKKGEKEIQDLLELDSVLTYIEPNLAKILKNLPRDIKEVIEEIRIRLDRPLMICMRGKDYFINKHGDITENEIDSYIITDENIGRTFQLLSNYSVYALEEELRNGFITIKGGHRVGISGKAVYGLRGIETIKEISSLNIRIAREKLGVSDKVMPYLIKRENNIYHTLIVSPPQCGKTTLLRDLIRNISSGMPSLNFKGLKVGVVDERSEIANVYRGRPQCNLGFRTDVLDSCHKYDGMMILIRSMSPNVIATDELGDEKDIKAIHEALKVGIKLIATVHGEDLNDIQTKPNLKALIDEKIFKRIIILDNSLGVGTIRDIIDGDSLQSIIDKRGEKECS